MNAFFFVGSLFLSTGALLKIIGLPLSVLLGAASFLVFSKRKELAVAAVFFMIGAVLSLRQPVQGEALGVVSSLKGRSAFVRSVKIWNGEKWKKVPGYGYAKIDSGGRVFCAGIELRKGRYPEYRLSECHSFPVDLGFVDRIKLYIWERRKDLDELNTLTAKMITSTPDDIVRRAGVSHIFAISGFHIGIYFVLAVIIISSFTANMFVVYPLALFVAYVLSIQSGPSPSALRALVFISIWVISRLIDYPVSVLNVLGIAALLSLLEDVYIVFSPSFLMSYSATFGILLSLKSGERWCMIPLWAYLYSLPFSIMFFNNVNFLSPLVSMVVSPYISVLVFSGAIFSLLNIAGLKEFSMLLFSGLKPLEFPLNKLFWLVSRVPSVELSGISSVVLSFVLAVVVVWLTRKRLC